MFFHVDSITNEVAKADDSPLYVARIVPDGMITEFSLVRPRRMDRNRGAFARSLS